MTLNNITLSYEYRSDSANIVDDFYVPCFKESIEYYRAVGYFTSSGLSLAGKGLVPFLQSGGRMRLIASPLLDAEDIEALSKGYQARKDAVERAILHQLGEEYLEKLSETSRTRLACLSWLIAENRLDIKIALPSVEFDLNTQAIYHEKIGIFIDNDGNRVAFTGSPNETVGGLVSNFESIDVFLSWDDPHHRVKQKFENFERLWTNETKKLEIFEFPEAAQRRLLTFRTKNRPEHDPESVQYGKSTPIVEAPISWKAPVFEPPSDLKLYHHQVAAIKAWNETDNKFPQAKRIGFLEMATGSGKTKTALCLAAQLYRELGRLAIIVVVPSTLLIDQWSDEAEKFGLLPVKAHGENPKWEKESWHYARSFRRNHIDRAFIVVTNKSFSTASFQEMLSEFGSHLLLIADEAHNLGSEQAVKYLPQGVEYRLALSATPRRYFDEEGSQLLFDYFGKSVYQFTLKDAIGVCLTPYDYFVTPVELSQDEAERYNKLTSRIARLRSRKIDEDKSNSRLDYLYRERSRIVSNAERKIDALSQLIDDVDLKKLKHTFVYTSDKDPEQTQKVLDLLQKDKHLLVHQFTEKESGNKQLREELLRRFEAGDNLQVLVAKRCLDEGIDIPPTRYAYFLASTTNPRQYIQRRGRLLRKFPGKTHAIIHDFLVIPPLNTASDNEDIELHAIISEFTRIVEFATTARNGASTRLSLLKIAKILGVTHLVAGGV